MSNTTLYESAKNEINALWVAMGYPDRNDGRDTTTETCGFDLAEYNSDDAGHTESADEYNQQLELLASMIDKRHIGSGIWYTSAYSTPEFDKFAEEATPIIENFIKSYEW